jgi:hypothetical protein
MVLNLPALTAASIGRHHVGELRATFGVVLVAGCQLAVIRRGHQVAVAVDQHLPTHLHRFRVDAGEQRPIGLGLVEIAGLARQRDVELAAAEHARGVVDLLVHRVALVREDAVEALHIGQLGDLVADEVVEPDAGDAGVDLVVDPRVAAVVVAVLVRGVRVVGVAHGIAQAAIGLGAHDGLALVGDAPAHQGVGNEAGDAGDFAAGGQAQHSQVAGVATAPKAVVGVELARLQVHIGASVSGRGGGRRRTGGGGSSRCRGGLLFLAGGQSHAGQAGSRRRVEEPAARRGLGGVCGVRVVVAHGMNPSLGELRGCGCLVSASSGSRLRSMLGMGLGRALCDTGRDVLAAVCG